MVRNEIIEKIGKTWTVDTLFERYFNTENSLYCINANTWIDEIYPEKVVLVLKNTDFVLVEMLSFKCTGVSCALLKI